MTTDSVASVKRPKRKPSSIKTKPVKPDSPIPVKAVLAPDIKEGVNFGHFGKWWLRATK